MSIPDQSDFQKPHDLNAVLPPWLELLRDAVGSVDFGTVQIKVHDSEVVQIETTRKIRVPSRSGSNLHSTAPAEIHQQRRLA
jgi:hypothetical protein